MSESEVFAHVIITNMSRELIAGLARLWVAAARAAAAAAWRAATRQQPARASLRRRRRDACAAPGAASLRAAKDARMPLRWLRSPSNHTNLHATILARDGMHGGYRAGGQ